MANQPIFDITYNQRVALDAVFTRTIMGDMRGQDYADLSSTQQRNILFMTLKRVGVLDEAGRVQ